MLQPLQVPLEPSSLYLNYKNPLFIEDGQGREHVKARGVGMRVCCGEVARRQGDEVPFHA